MKGGQRGVGQARFNPAQVGAEHLAAVCQFLLRDALLRAQLLDSLAKNFTWIGLLFAHPPNVWFVYSLIHTLIRTFTEGDNGFLDDIANPSLRPM